MTQVAVIGAGLIGRAWSIVFARAGFDVAAVGPGRPAGRGSACFHRRTAARIGAGRPAEGTRRSSVVRRVRPAATLGRGGARRRARAGERTGAGRREAGAVRRTGPRWRGPTRCWQVRPAAFRPARSPRAWLAAPAAWSRIRSIRPTWSRWSSCARRRGPIRPSSRAPVR